MRQLKKILTFEEAYDSALQKLARSDCSSKAMYTYLSKRGCCKEDAQAVVTKLLERNYISDEKLCRYLGQRWQEQGLFGKKMFIAKLINQGFDKNLVDETLANLDVDEKAKAKKLFFSYIKGIRHCDDKTLGKITRYLASKGFSYGVIKSVLEDEREILLSLSGQSCLDTYFKNLYN